jgi:hypothetical protein
MFAAFLLVVFVALFRILTGISHVATEGWLHQISWIPNFQPIQAVFLCCTAVLPKGIRWVFPSAALLISNAVINSFFNQPQFSGDSVAQIGALMLVGYMGVLINRNGQQPTLPVLLGASILGSVVFYIVTNTGSWAIHAGYEKTIAGWVRALTTGDPAYAPTWMFLRNSLVSDFLFTGLFWLCVVRAHGPGSMKQFQSKNAIAGEGLP